MIIIDNFGSKGRLIKEEGSTQCVMDQLIDQETKNQTSRLDKKRLDRENKVNWVLGRKKMGDPIQPRHETETEVSSIILLNEFVSCMLPAKETSW